MAGDRDAVRALLKQGADVNAAQGDGMTALHWAAADGDARPASGCCSYAGANVARDDAARRLHAAAAGERDGHAAMIEALLAGGADVESRDGERHDPADARGGVGQRRRREDAARRAAPTSTRREPVRGETALDVRRGVDRADVIAR